jgi:hypothetical protein
MEYGNGGIFPKFPHNPAIPYSALVPGLDVEVSVSTVLESSDANWHGDTLKDRSSLLRQRWDRESDFSLQQLVVIWGKTSATKLYSYY